MLKEEEITINTLLSKLDEITSVDLALQLSDLEDNDIAEICAKLSDKELANILEESEEKTQIRILDLLRNNRIINVFSYMSKDDIVDILGLINIGKSKELINLMKDGKDKKIITELLGYEDDTAGGIMTTEYIALKKDLTVSQALLKLKEIVSKSEVIETIFINDNKKIIGIANLRDILISPDSTKLEEITNTNFISVEPETDQEEVALLASKYDLNVIPVINKKNVLLGIITIDDIIDVIQEEQTEDVLRMAGVDKEENIDSTVFESIKMRLPWLIVNLVTAFLASLTVKIFEGTIAQVVALSAIMSIVTGMGGNAGTQTVSIIIRNIAMGKVELKDSLRLVIKEIILGLFNGAIIGILTGIIVTLIYGNCYLGVIIFLSMIGNLVISGICGILVPLILAKLKLDPALASSIFLTTATDVLGFFIFLSLAQVFLPKLI
ncbi:MAG: magnesium transporter [Clostridia bacterium]|jgi:magnesium transporter|nr:magnesium transporter [Clostridia bacterium]